MGPLGRCEKFAEFEVVRREYKAGETQLVLLPPFLIMSTPSKSNMAAIEAPVIEITTSDEEVIDVDALEEENRRQSEVKVAAAKARNDTIAKKKKAKAEQKRIDEECEAKRVADEAAEAKRIADEAIEAKRITDEAIEAKWVADEAAEVKRVADEKAAADKAKPVAGPSGVAKKGAQAREGNRKVVHSVSASDSLFYSDANSAQRMKEQLEVRQPSKKGHVVLEVRSCRFWETGTDFVVSSY